MLYYTRKQLKKGYFLSKQSRARVGDRKQLSSVELDGEQSTLEDITSAVAILASLDMKEESTSFLSKALTANAITWKTPAIFPNR